MLTRTAVNFLPTTLDTETTLVSVVDKSRATLLVILTAVVVDVESIFSPRLARDKTPLSITDSIFDVFRNSDTAPSATSDKVFDIERRTAPLCVVVASTYLEIIRNMLETFVVVNDKVLDMP